MDRLNKIFIGLACLTSFTLHAQQADKSMHTEGKHGLTLNGMRYSTVASFTYSYSFWQNQAFNTGAQVGFGYGGDFDRYGGWAFPLGLFAEYGKKHRIGFDANVIYQYSTTLIPGQIPNPDNTDFQDLRVVFDNGVFTSSIYYSFNFVGKAEKYNVGIGYNLQHYFGSNYGRSFDEYPLEHAPFIFLGVRF